jgi:PAS domain S-box-containing protein
MSVSGSKAAAPTPPPADLSQLEQIVTGLLEGVILIDPDRRVVWANGAALAMHGVETLQDLGCNIDEYLANFVLRYPDGRDLDHCQHPVNRVLAGEAFDDVVVEVRHRRLGKLKWTHRIRSLIIRGGDGRTERLALIVHNASEQAAAELRFERMFAANPAPALICRLSDLRFIRVNEGFVQLSGFTREDVLDRSVYEIDVLQGAEQRDLAIQCLKRGETIPQMEACLRFPNDAERYVIVAGQPLEVEAQPCMLFTFADLEDRRKAEMALQQSEERFAKSFRLSPVPTTIEVARDHRYLDVNDAFGTALGFDVGDVIGRTADELDVWAEPHERTQFEKAVASRSSVRNLEARFRAQGGGEIECLVSAEMVTINGEPSILSVFQDITERKRSERDLAAAIEAAMADAQWFSRGVMDKLAALRHEPGSITPSPTLEELTSRERDILTLICKGAGDAEIASELNLSPHTVRNHVASLYRKLGVNRRSAVVIWARERGIDGVIGKPSKSRKPK